MISTEVGPGSTRLSPHSSRYVRHLCRLSPCTPHRIHLEFSSTSGQIDWSLTRPIALVLLGIRITLVGTVDPTWLHRLWNSEMGVTDMYNCCKNQDTIATASMKVAVTASLRTKAQDSETEVALDANFLPPTAGITPGRETTSLSEMEDPQIAPGGCPTSAHHIYLPLIHREKVGHCLLTCLVLIPCRICGERRLNGLVACQQLRL